MPDVLGMGLSASKSRPLTLCISSRGKESSYSFVAVCRATVPNVQTRKSTLS